MYQYADLVKEKLMRDSAAFLRPSASSVLAVVMFDTLITDELVSLLAELLCGREKMFRRVCLIGADRNVQEKLDRALWGKHSFSYCFLNDTEAAKEWLLP